MADFKPINFYDKIKDSKKYYNPRKDAPQHPAMFLICGGTGSGKTLTLLNTIKYMACFEKFLICTKLKDEPLYDYLKESVSSVDPSRIVLTDNVDEILTQPELENINNPLQTLIIFDDMVGENKAVQKKIFDVFLKCRKTNCSAVYISQSFFAVPKDIRLQSHYVILKSINAKKELRYVIRDYGLTMPLDELMDYYNSSTGDVLSFFTIDLKDGNKPNSKHKKFRKNFASITHNDSDKVPESEISSIKEYLNNIK